MQTESGWRAESGGRYSLKCGEGETHTTPHGARKRDTLPAVEWGTASQVSHCFHILRKTLRAGDIELD